MLPRANLSPVCPERSRQILRRRLARVMGKGVISPRSWPAKLPAGAVYENPVMSLDLLATFTAAAGKPVTTEDSVNLLPFLKGEKTGAPQQFGDPAVGFVVSAE